MEDFNGDKTEGKIAFGGAAEEPKANVDPTVGFSRVASLELALTSTGASMHNQGIKVGNSTYVIQSGGKELKGDLPTGVKIIKVADADDATAVATKLAAVITADEKKQWQLCS